MVSKDKICITGGAGYLGSILVEKCLARGYRVCVLDNMTYSDVGLAGLVNDPNLSVQPGDIRDRMDIRHAFTGCSHVIHLAAIANDPSGELAPALTRSINLESYSVLLEEAQKAGVKRFLNASTFSVYGIQSRDNITETSPLNPLKEYSICKAKSEESVKSSNSSHFITTSLRCATICGWSPRMRFDLIVNTLTFHALVKGKISVWGGEQMRPQIHIQDLSDYFIKFLTAPAHLIGGEVFNAGGENITIMQIAQSIQDVMGKGVAIETSPPRDDERSYHCSSGKIARVMDLIPRYSVKDAVREIIEAYDRGLWKNPEDPIYHNVKQVKNNL